MLCAHTGSPPPYPPPPKIPVSPASRGIVEHEDTTAFGFDSINDSQVTDAQGPVAFEWPNERLA